MTNLVRHMTPGPEHPITIQLLDARILVRTDSVRIAVTERALEMREASYPPVLYIPLDDVDRRLLRQSDRHTFCPYKGDASYYDIIDGDGSELAAAVWYYADPFQAVAKIKGHVAFYADRVTISETPG